MEIRLQYWREKKGLTQARLAELSGVAQSSISEIEGGKSSPNITTITKLSQALNVSITELVVCGDKKVS